MILAPRTQARIMRAIKQARDAAGLQTYQVEYVFVLGVLLLTRFLTGGFSAPSLTEPFAFGSLWHDPMLRVWLADWVAVLGVFFSFSHASVADRLAETEGERVTAGQAPLIECYSKLGTYFVAREIAWCAVFLLLHSWSALAGVLIFLTYPSWRRAWRRQYPVATSPRVRKP